MSTPPRLAVGLAVAVLVSLATPVHALAGPTSRAPSPGSSLPCAAPLVASPVGGRAAVKALGARLPEAAAKMGRTPAAYRALLRSDPTLRVDGCGHTFVVEPAMTAAERAAAAADDAVTSVPRTALGALDGGDDAFALNSRPGSRRTIYLDFNGADITGTVWNTYGPHPDVVAAPYDTDGSPATFSTAERDSIRSVWLHVAEDYAPFDVNVTTADPGQAAITRSGVGDLVYGTRALITNDLVLFADVCNSQCGGVAYVGVFDEASQHDFLQPALIFQRALGGSSATAKTIAEAAAHEVGHNLGLSHDGTVAHGSTAASGYYTGSGAWAPIMGAGYYEPVSQWSRGQYQYANNQEDDLAVIAANGAPFVVDDHADGPSGATVLPYSQFAADGVIGANGDGDWFTFTVPAGAGDTAVRVFRQGVGGDLDVALTVYDGAGTLVATVDPPVNPTAADHATGLDATMTQTLAPGTYTAMVAGAGVAGNSGYSSYGSLGRYTISAADVNSPIPTTPLPVAPPTGTPPPFPTVWTGTLAAAVSALTVGAESTTSGYSAARFPLVDADHDCRKTRAEVLATESLSKVSWKNAKHCVVSRGRWLSSFDRHSVKKAAKVSAVWTVPLGEAWQSGAGSWTTARRQAYANDLADSRTLLAVTKTSAAARADREPTSWLPVSASRCSYLAGWVAVKLRWGLTADGAEQGRLATLAASCSGTRLTVHRA